ncbi:MAG TPA: hypothetical protein VNJ01_06345 [Bacteriovoracaceae bacterium]|nr:hypothetical protein [Bacteriovoracaceae bacterium]
MRWLIFLFFFTACSGYRFSQQENPLAAYGIHSLSVPMFYNYSNQPEVSADFTRETYRLLTGFSGLRLKSGYSKDSDAVLIGIIKSPEKMAQTLTPRNPKPAQDTVKGPFTTNRRQKFSIPYTTDVSMYLQVIVIKKPSEEELTLLRSGIGDKIDGTSSIVFNELIPLRIQYTRELLDNKGVQVLATQNQGVQRKNFKGLAEQAAVSIRDMILYAF